jgi:hypothetical protein
MTEAQKQRDEIARSQKQLTPPGRVISAKSFSLPAKIQRAIQETIAKRKAAQRDR